jgi:hypothetical protein
LHWENHAITFLTQSTHLLRQQELLDPREGLYKSLFTFWCKSNESLFNCTTQKAVRIKSIKAKQFASPEQESLLHDITCNLGPTINTL